MQMLDSTPKIKHLVLLGGGHSHLAVLMAFAKKPLPGLAITLISEDIEVPYSGALPASIRGEYTHDQMHIDLRPLAQMAGARLIRCSVELIDAGSKQVYCAARPTIPFDILSINIGSRPAGTLLPGAQLNAIAVKPITNFLSKWQEILPRALHNAIANQSYSIAIVGGGAASVELALAMQWRLLKELARKSNDKLAPRISLICRNPRLLAEHGERAQEYALETLRQRNIDVHLGCEASQIYSDRIKFHSVQDPHTIQTLITNEVILATGASAPQWLKNTGISLTKQGFIEVGETLQSVSHPWIFATGDIAEIMSHPRPRSGVYAVRQGRPLADNLRRYAAGRNLKRHVPQTNALALISTAPNSAIASRNTWAWQGRTLAIWKRWIDGQFLHKYQRVAPPVESRSDSIEYSQRPGLNKSTSTIRCSGCGAKVGGLKLQNVLAQLAPCTHSDIVSQHRETEDAAIIRIDDRRVQLQSVDHFRAFLSDPYLFARIATVHCLSDIHAMGALPHSALAIVSIPYASDTIMEAMLLEVMSGATEVLNEHNTALIGGHTGEAKELSFGLSVNGFADPSRLMRKSGTKPGDALVLCKPIGTGTLFAADMRYQAKQRWIERALNHMQKSNHAASQCFMRHGAHACTDITGFGLIGHLQEMLAPRALSAQLTLNAIPVMDGAVQCIAKGYTSSLHPENISAAKSLGINPIQLGDPRVQLLFDPQTAGGLLAAVPQDSLEACLEDLRTAGYELAAHIGSIEPGNPAAHASIQLL